MAGTFGQRIRQLSDQVGSGALEGSVVVDQPYAKYQHEDLSLNHPGGGKAEYLRDPMMGGFDGYLRDIARQVLDGGAPEAMVRAMEDVAAGVYAEAPFEFGDLKASPHPKVTDGGTTYYDRPPMIHRLTDEEIKIKRDLRALGLGNVRLTVD